MTMSVKTIKTIVPLLMLAAMGFAATPDCESLSRLNLAHTKITLAQTVSAGSFTPPHGEAVGDLPGFCRVTAVNAPVAGSEINFEVWLPTKGWNGKFQGVGNGGFAGVINYGQMGNAVRHGYATASTDTGHSAASNSVDASWALRRPQKIADFGYRAIHNTATNAKAVIEAFYGSPAKRSYFSSCSNGGRQALMEAQRYPGDYDGIIAGAPANYWTHLLANAAADERAMLSQPTTYLPAAKLPAIQAAAVAACDARDGVQDGVIEDPQHCHFDTQVLLCKGTESDACLTPPQLASLNQLYEGALTSRRKLVLAGYSPGGEAEPGGWQLWITGPAPRKSLMYSFATQFFSNMVFNDASWDVNGFDVDRDTKLADGKMARALNANNPDLSRFEKRGGKLILYHGWSDAAIPATATINYYQRIVATMGAARTHDFVRLFMVPGMQHCFGGAAPDEFGQLDFASGDEKHSVDAALERWVEGGGAPESVIASKHDSQIAAKVTRTRPLCAYPAVAVYKGSGSTDEADNFTCRDSAFSR